MTAVYVERESHTSDARFSALTVKDKDDNQRVVGSDYSLPTVDVNHLRLHEGRAFYAYKMYLPSAGLAVNANLDMVLTSSVGVNLHLVVGAQCDQNSTLTAYEDVTVNSGGTVFVPVNRNRLINTPSTTGILINPTLTINDGIINQEYLAAGDSKKTGGVSAYSSEYVLKANLSYLFRLTNIGATAAGAYLSLEWYE